SDPWIQGLGWRLPAGIGVAALLWRWRERIDALAARPAVRRTVGTLALGTVWLAALQTPWNVVDTNHMLYTSDELLAPAAGRWPLVDYLPQYSNLLGIPLAALAPIVRLAPVHAAVVASVLLVAMTLWIFLRVIRERGSSGSGWAVVAAAVAWPAFSNGFFVGGERALGALNSGAMRPLLPLLVGLLIGGMLRPVDRGRAALLGALAGTAALANVDFGAPALLAAFAATAIVSLAGGDGPAGATARLGAVATGAVVGVAVLLGLIGVLGGGRPRPLLGALTALTYSRFGWFDVAMPVYGPHSLVGVLFLASAGLGILRLTRASGAATTDARRRATAIRAVYFGLLGVGVLPYYAGRSLTPVLVIGYAFLIGTCAACVLTLTANRLAWVALVGAGLAAWTFVPQPFQSLGRLAGSGTGETHDMVRVVDLGRRAAEAIAGASELAPGAEVGIVASSGNSLALETGLTNAVLASNAAFITLGDYWTALQCEHLSTTGLDVVLVEDPAVAEALRTNAECADALDQASARLLSTGWTAIDLRPDGR
ncbi:MAG: hypothetical protein RL283_1592, partial [Actinomycetota bacterium]